MTRYDVTLVTSQGVDLSQLQTASKEPETSPCFNHSRPRTEYSHFSTTNEPLPILLRTLRLPARLVTRIMSLQIFTPDISLPCG